MFWIKKTPFLSQGYEEQIRWHIPRYEEEPPVNTAPIPSAAKGAVYFIQQFTPELLKLSQVDSLGDVSSHKPTDPRTERNKVKTHPQKEYRVSESFSKNVSCDSQYLHRIFILTAFNHRYNTTKCGWAHENVSAPHILFEDQGLGSNLTSFKRYNFLILSMALEVANLESLQLS